MPSVVARAEVSGSWSEVVAALASSDLPLQGVTETTGGGHAWIGLEHAPRASLATDPLFVTLREGLLVIQARTATWGPGYHQAVVEVLGRLGACLARASEGLRAWDEVCDPSGYAQSGDRAALEQSFLETASELWEQALSGSSSRFLIGLDPSCAPAQVPPGMVATPTGYKDRAWVREVGEALKAAHGGGELSQRAREAFLWWAPEPDALDWIQRGRLLCACEVIWRPLIAMADSPAQIEAREQAYACFTRALALDPDAPVPAAEFDRLAELLALPAPPEQEEAPEVGVVEPLAPPGTEPADAGLGYRDGYVRRRLNQAWRVQLPGWLRVGRDADDGHDVFWDSGFTVRITARRRARAFRRAGEIARHLSCFPEIVREAARVVRIDEGPIEGYAIILEGVLGCEALVTGQVACGHERVSFTAVARSEEASRLALRLPRDFLVK